MRPRLGVMGAAVAAMLAGIAAGKADTIKVDIAQLAFSPAEVSARVGDTVEWVSSDFVVHTATARDKQWDVTIPSKGTGSVVLKSAGVIDYYCRFHPNMHGRVTVTEK